MSKLFSPVKFGPVQLSNRVVVAPMCQYSAHMGCASDWHLFHLGQLALSGAGLLILEAAGVTPEGRITAWDLGLWSDENEQALAKVLAHVRALSPIKLGIQLAHAGRKASSKRPWDGGQLIPANDPFGWQTVAPSPIPHASHEPPPHELTVEDIKGLTAAFVASAKRAARLGFEVIEIHAAHGYLLHQFLSPLSNQRLDAYGGNLENRMRYPLEVFDAVKAAVPDHVAVGIRVSATDWVDNKPSWTMDQTVTLAKALEARGCDFIHVSSGGLSTEQKINIGPGYQLPFASAMKAEVKMPVIAVGLITDAKQAEDVITQEKADAVALARAFLYNPRWAWHAAAALGAQVYGPPQYWRGLPREASGLFGNIQIGQR